MTEEALKVTQDECDICGKLKGQHVDIVGAGLVCPVSAVTYRPKRIEHSPTPARNEVLEEAAKAAELDGFAGNRHRRATETADDIATRIRALKTPTPEPTNPAGLSGVVEERDDDECALCGCFRMAHEDDDGDLICPPTPGSRFTLRTPAPDAGLREALARATLAVKQVDHSPKCNIHSNATDWSRPYCNCDIDERRARAALTPTPEPTIPAGLSGVVEAWDDLRTHRSAWRNAIIAARDYADSGSEDDVDRSYWEHELRAFDRTFTALSRTPAPDAGLREALERLDYNLSSAPPEAEKCFVSLDDHRTILAALSQSPRGYQNDQSS